MSVIGHDGRYKQMTIIGHDGTRHRQLHLRYEFTSPKNTGMVKSLVTENNIQDHVVYVSPEHRLLKVNTEISSPKF